MKAKNISKISDSSNRDDFTDALDYAHSIIRIAAKHGWDWTKFPVEPHFAEALIEHLQTEGFVVTRHYDTILEVNW